MIRFILLLLGITFLASCRTSADFLIVNRKVMDGGGPLPMGEYLEDLEKQGVGINVAYLIGHNSVRNEVMGQVNRAPTEKNRKQWRPGCGQAWIKEKIIRKSAPQKIKRSD